MPMHFCLWVGCVPVTHFGCMVPCFAGCVVGVCWWLRSESFDGGVVDRLGHDWFTAFFAKFLVGPEVFPRRMWGQLCLQ